MTLEHNIGCDYDRVFIYNDFNSESQQGCRLCYHNFTLPYPTVATGQQMLVQFDTDNSVQYAGFSARFESVDRNGVPLQLCEGTFVVVKNLLNAYFL